MEHSSSQSSTASSMVDHVKQRDCHDHIWCQPTTCLTCNSHTVTGIVGDCRLFPRESSKAECLQLTSSPCQQSNVYKACVAHLIGAIELSAMAETQGQASPLSSSFLTAALPHAKALSLSYLNLGLHSMLQSVVNACKACCGQSRAPSWQSELAATCHLSADDMELGGKHHSSI